MEQDPQATRWSLRLTWGLLLTLRTPGAGGGGSVHDPVGDDVTLTARAADAGAAGGRDGISAIKTGVEDATVSDGGIIVSEALYKAVIGTLRATLTVPVYDEAPHGAGMPLVVLDQMLSLNDDGLAAQRERVMVYLSVWDRATDALGVLAIMAEIKAALHNSRPALDQGTCVILREVRRTTDRDIDRSVRIGRLTYQARIKP